MRASLVRCFACAALISGAGGTAAARQRPEEAHALVAACRANNVTLTTRKLVELGPGVADALARELLLRAPQWSEAQLEAVVQALRERLADTRAALLSIARENPSLAAHTRALELLGDIGAPRDLATAVTIAGSALARDCVSSGLDDAPDATSALRACAARLIAKYDASSIDLPRALQGCPDQLAPALIDALVDVGRARELDLLAELLRSDAWSETYLLGALSRVARKLDAPFDERACASVRDELQGVDPARVREAAACSGWLEDAQAAEPIVELLAHSDRGVRVSARWALQRITGRSFAPNPVAWRRWLDQQSAWWNERAPELMVAIERGDAAKRFRALNEVARHRFPRHELARDLSRALPSGDAAALHLGCAALAGLNSKAALPALRELRELTDGAALESVKAALHALEPPPLPPGARTR